MNSRCSALRSVLILSAGLFTCPVQASFHLWDIQEVYSNADGSVQFIELFTTFNGQQFVGGHPITTTTNNNTFTFPNNSPSPTGSHHLLLATPGFGALNDGITPDFTISMNFFDPGGDTINFVGANMVTFSSAPTDNTNSLNYPGAIVATNSPTNYAGDTGSIVAPGVSGDYSDNGTVEQADLDLVLLNWGATWPPAIPGWVNDQPVDGVIDQNDLDGVLLNWGNTSAPASVVPEPTGVMLILMGIGIGFLRTPVWHIESR